MPKTLLIIDDFLQNADEIRAAGLAVDYPLPEEKRNFPGRNSDKRLLIDGLDQEISRLVGEPLMPTPGTGHGKFRLALEGEEGAGKVHVDPQCVWSGILYLSRPEDCQGGTDFFRHIPTGLDHAPYTNAQLAAAGLNSFQDISDKILLPDSRNMEKWEPIMRVPMRFNRLVLLRPWYWHTAGPGFGRDVVSGRLVYLMFFQNQQTL